MGVALVTTGPGATNVITPFVGAWIESIPILVISGQVKSKDLMKKEDNIRQSGVQEVDIVPPVAAIYSAVDADDWFPSSVTIQPFVESIKINVAASPFVFNLAFTVDPPILSEPFWIKTTLFVPKFAA